MWVEGEFADELAGVFGDDADVEFADEHEDAGAGPVVADADVVQAAVVPEGEFAVAVDAVLADAEVFADVCALPGRGGAGPGGPGCGRSLPVDAPVRAFGVVVGGEVVQLGLQLGDGRRWWQAGESLLEGLVQPFDFAAGGRVVGPGVAQRDAEGGTGRQN